MWQLKIRKKSGPGGKGLDTSKWTQLAAQGGVTKHIDKQKEREPGHITNTKEREGNKQQRRKKNPAEGGKKPGIKELCEAAAQGRYGGKGTA